MVTSGRRVRVGRRHDGGYCVFRHCDGAIPVCAACSEKYFFDNKFYHWNNGVLFRITQNKQDKVYSLPVIKFEAEKWRSPLGAYWFSNCTAVWPQMGAWTRYTVEAELIS